MKMKSYHGNLGTGIDGLVVREHDIPTPGPKEVVVRVKAASFNFREIMILKFGYYPLPIKKDVVPFSEGAGEVVAIGKEVNSVKVEDRVAGVVFPYWQAGPFSLENSAQLGGSLDGMLTEYAVLPEVGVLKIPDYLSYEEAATFPCIGVTAWNALTGGKPLLAGESVLVLGSGGVSLFALQFAKLFGARVIATTSHDEKAKKLKELGADEVINYQTTPEWEKEVRKVTDGQGVDHVVEVGGPGTILKSVASTKPSGEVAIVGSLTAGAPADDKGLQRAIVTGVVSLRGISAGSRAQLAAMNEAIATHKLKPVINRTFSFDEVKTALHYYEDTKPFGKIVISL